MTMRDKNMYFTHTQQMYRKKDTQYTHNPINTQDTHIQIFRL